MFSARPFFSFDFFELLFPSTWNPFTLTFSNCFSKKKKTLFHCLIFSFLTTERSMVQSDKQQRERAEEKRICPLISSIPKDHNSIESVWKIYFIQMPRSFVHRNIVCSADHRNRFFHYKKKKKIRNKSVLCCRSLLINIWIKFQSKTNTTGNYTYIWNE